MKIDQNWTDRQRTSVSYSRDTGDALNGFMAQRHPYATGGTQTAIASVLSVCHTTNLNSSMINEFTGGFQRPRLRFNRPWELNGIDKVLPSTFFKGKRGATGNGVVYFPSLLNTSPDPAIASFTPLNNIRGTSNLLAVRDASGQVVFRNPVAGELGNLAPYFLSGPGVIRLDMNVPKVFKVVHKRKFILQLDAENALNSPQWNNPNADINSVNFGRITGSSDNRILLLGARFNF